MSEEQQTTYKISIVTINQFKRRETIKMTLSMLEEQTFRKHIYEWVIVEASPDRDSAEINALHVRKMQNTTEIPIKYVEYEEGRKLGRARNVSNDNATGDYIVCMDDDDYYFPERIEHGVTEMIKGGTEIAGCTGILIHDYLLERQYATGDFGPLFSTNNCMVYTKNYANKHRYDDEKTFGEENDFTNNFTEPMTQLDQCKTAIMCSHQINTYNKRFLMILGTFGIHKTIRETTKEFQEKYFIPEKYFLKYKSLFINDKLSKYDIAYVCGFFGIHWNPSDKSLGGSEQAVVHLSEQWAKKGYKICVYGNVPEVTINNVDYFPMNSFPYDNMFKNVVVWRESGMLSVLPFPLKSYNIVVDFHDNMALSQQIDIHKMLLTRAHCVMFNSETHKRLFEEKIGIKISENNYKIVPNGVRIEDFKEQHNVTRDPFRFCYCSCYTRGLIPIVAHMWGIIQKLEPRAELHVYYGMEHVQGDQINVLKQLLALQGVMDHGRQPSEIVAREKHRSAFQLYISNSPLEIDCISVKESLVAGCIPLISNDGVFKERDGIHFDMDFTSVDSYNQTALKIVELMKNRYEVEKIRKQLKKSPTIISWEEVAEQWISKFTNINK